MLNANVVTYATTAMIYRALNVNIIHCENNLHPSSSEGTVYI